MQTAQRTNTKMLGPLRKVMVNQHNKNQRNSNKMQAPKKQNQTDNKRVPENTKIPALVIGGALVGNMIIPGLGGAIVGGILGGLVGSQSNNKNGGK
jgi:hypothetical protein